MLANALIFALGALVASLAFLLFVPLLWRKAQRLARRTFDATYPTTVNEIRAEADKVRAEAALAIRRGEVLAAEIREASARERAEAGRLVVVNAELAEREKFLVAENARLSAELAMREGETAEALRRQGEAERAQQARADDLETLVVSYRQLEALVAEQRAQIAALGTGDAALDAQGGRIDPTFPDTAPEPLAVAEAASDRGGEVPVSSAPANGSGTIEDAADRTPPLAELASANDRLRTAMAKQHGRPRTAAERADIRDRIGDIAARVIQLTADAEGPESPLAGLLNGRSDETATAAAGTVAAGEKPLSLAERVRRLARGDNRDQDVTGAQDPAVGRPTGVAERRSGGA